MYECRGVQKGVPGDEKVLHLNLGAVAWIYTLDQVAYSETHTHTHTAMVWCVPQTHTLETSPPLQECWKAELNAEPCLVNVTGLPENRGFLLFLHHVECSKKALLARLMPSCALILVLGWLRYKDCCKFKASLDYKLFWTLSQNTQKRRKRRRKRRIITISCIFILVLSIWTSQSLELWETVWFPSLNQSAIAVQN